MNTTQDKDYKAIKRVGSWSAVLMWVQIIALPLVILYPYLLNKSSITPQEFLVTGAINVTMITFIVVMLVIKGEPLKHPENMSVRQIRKNTNWLAWPILIFAAISLATGGHYGLVWILFVIVIAKAKQVAKNYEKTGRQSIYSS